MKQKQRKKCVPQCKFFSKYLFHINWNVSFWKKKALVLIFLYYMWFWKEISFWTPLKWIKDLTFPKCLILRMKFHYNALNIQSFMLKSICNLLKENMFHFLPLYVTRSNCKYLVHNQDFCFHGSQSICTVFIKTLIDISWCRKKQMNNRLKGKQQKAIFILNPTNLNFTDFTLPTPSLQGIVQELWISQDLAPCCNIKCISSITSPNCYWTACIHTVQGLKGTGREGYSSHHLLVTANVLYRAVFKIHSKVPFWDKFYLDGFT